MAEAGDGERAAIEVAGVTVGAAEFSSPSESFPPTSWVGRGSGTGVESGASADVGATEGFVGVSRATGRDRWMPGPSIFRCQIQV